jgi:activating signal cointegrator 1
MITRKCLSLWQPWASLIAYGFKRKETRSWHTTHKGELLIHAAKRSHREQIEFYDMLRCDKRFNVMPAWEDLQKGAVIAIVHQDDCVKMSDELIKSQTKLELTVGDWTKGRFAHFYSDIRKVNPEPLRGCQGMFSVEGEFQYLNTNLNI